MITRTYRIAGGDYKKGGAASGRLKDILKKTGAEPADIRRAIIAAYEAEMNVVVHTGGGSMSFILDTDRLDVEIVDEGPGIPDIEQAMVEGYSTAPAEARKLGFGAGMGLPNIKRNSDRFDMRSHVGGGTKVRFTINLRNMTETGTTTAFISANQELCTHCMCCIKACPTRALRVRASGPEILSHLCIDCTACTTACIQGVFKPFPSADLKLPPPENTVLVIPTAFAAQFGMPDMEAVIGIITRLGFHNTYISYPWEEALKNTVTDYALKKTENRPVISPVCPAVVSLIEVRFPSLIENLAPFTSPLAAARADLGDQPLVVVAACGAHYAELFCQETESGGITVIEPAGLYNAVIEASGNGQRISESCTPIRRREAGSEERILTVTGLGHVEALLEQVENGLLDEIPVIEPYACDLGCFGSPLFREHPFVARHRWTPVPGDTPLKASSLERRKPFRARPGLRLDSDLSESIRKLSEIQAFARMLPGRNCGQCGAPSCEALAMDVALGRTTMNACTHLHKDKEKRR